MSGGALGYDTQAGEIEINAGRATTTVLVANTGDRAVQVGSHYHFYEANAALSFDREAAYGKHLAIPSGLAIRFEPGDEREVELVDFGGKRVLYGFSNVVNGPLDDPEVKAAAAQRLVDFLENSNSEDNVSAGTTPAATASAVPAETATVHSTAAQATPAETDRN